MTRVSKDSPRDERKERPAPRAHLRIGSGLLHEHRGGFQPRPDCSSGCPRRRQLGVSRYSNWRFMLRVTDGRGLTVCQHFVTIQDHMPKLEVRLPERESDRGGATSGTVSVTELMHPLKPTSRPRCGAPNFGRRHRHVLLPKLWVRLAESEWWDNQRRFNSLHGPHHSAANGQWNANSCSTSGCRSVSTFMSRSL